MQKIYKICVAGLLFLTGSYCAQAGYVGESFLRIPGVDAGVTSKDYPGWLRFESREWVETPACPNQSRSPFVCDGQMWQPRISRLFISAPWAPASGSGKLAVALDKNSEAYDSLIAFCEKGDVIPELFYAESSQRSRRIGEVGTLAEVPPYYEYRLIDVDMDCPQVSGAPEQAIILAFTDIEWMNFKGEGQLKTDAQPLKLPPLPAAGERRTFLLTWMQPAGSASTDDCPQLNSEPSEDDYFALWPRDKVANGKLELQKQGGLAELRDGISFRGPEKLSVCALPGIVPDPGHAAPQSDVVAGFDLDGYSGKGERPAHIHAHRNFVSVDGRTGIDNQTYVVEGCVPGFRPDGNIPKVSNEMMRNGSVTILVTVSGIDDIENDDSVTVSWIYSKDLMEKTADGSGILPNYTFRLSDNPEFTQFSTHFKARIENGVVVTDPLDEMTLQDGGQTAFKLFDARLRMEISPDGNLNALIGGYQDWRRRATNWTRNRILEPTMRFQCPGLYNAYRRAADGLWDPETEQFNGISIAYRIEGVKAYLPEGELESFYASSQ